MATYYCDASALLKLVVPERESQELRSFINGARLISSQIVLAEIPRACHRIADREPSVVLDRLLRQAERQLGSLDLLPLETELLRAAGALDEPHLRSLDAIHVVTAIHFAELDAFVTYDQRQAAAARLAGLPAYSPGV